MWTLVAVGLLAGGCGPTTADSSGLEDTAGPQVEGSVGDLDRYRAEGFAVVRGPLIEMPDNEDVGLVRLLGVDTSLPSRLSFELEGDEGTRTVAFEAWSTEHRVPVLGLRTDSEYRITPTVEGLLGESMVLDPIVFRTRGLPESFPDMELLVHDPSRMEPGYRLITLADVSRETGITVVFDMDMEPVWFHTSLTTSDVRVSSRGTLVGLTAGVGFEVDWTGQPQRRYTNKPDDPATDREIPWKTLHHEFFENDEGSYWSLAHAKLQVGRYPTDYDEPHLMSGPHRLVDAEVVHFDREGDVIETLKVSDYLDTERIGFDSLDKAGESYDWVHANSLVETRDGGLVISSRHQDCVFKIDADRELAWILGNPLGYRSEFEEFLLEKVEDTEFQWPYHQHGVMVADDGLILLFDNGYPRCTPYSRSCTDQETARAVAYRVDEEAMTVEQVWSYARTQTGKLVSAAVGDLDPMRTTGNALADFGMVSQEDGVTNLDMGRGQRSVRLIEFIPGTHPEPVLDVRFSTDVEESEEGLKSYRAEWIPGFYP